MIDLGNRQRKTKDIKVEKDLQDVVLECRQSPSMRCRYLERDHEDTTFVIGGSICGNEFFEQSMDSAETESKPFGKD